MHKIEGREDKTAGRKTREKEKKEIYYIVIKTSLKTGADIRVSTLRGVLRNRDSQVIM